MALILDTGILYAYYDQSDAWHERSFELMRGEPGELIVPSPVIPEVDHLLGDRLGREARSVFYRGLIEGYYFVAELPRESYKRVLEINDQYADLDLGFVDAAVVAIAENLELRRIATTDRRDFGVLQASMALVLLPP
jgi:predicted nucleic acid-binding protein